MYTYFALPYQNENQEVVSIYPIYLSPRVNTTSNNSSMIQMLVWFYLPGFETAVKDMKNPLPWTSESEWNVSSA